MKLSFEDHGSTRVISVGEPRIDAAIAIKFKDEMRGFVEEGASRLILDLSSVEFLDSSGLGAIVSIFKASSEGQTLELAGLTETVDRVFRLTRMDQVFTIHASVDDALPEPSANAV